MFVYKIPIDEVIENSFDVLRAMKVVVDIIRVLPHVNAHQRREAFVRNRRRRVISTQDDKEMSPLRQLSSETVPRSRTGTE